jgi:acyl-[acyl-carrier protein] desaturase
MSIEMERIEPTSRCRGPLCQHQEVIRAIEPVVADNLRLLVPIDKAWQPSDIRMMAELLEHDLAGGILAFRSMLRGRIAMPGRFMHDGRDPDRFDHFAIVAQRINVYTLRDYASIIGHLVTAWDIAGRAVTGEAARAQDELCREAERYERLAERTAAALAKQPPRAFSWIRDRAV